jgi:hypothetical protein
MNELAAIKVALLEKVNSHLEKEAAPITDIRFRQVSAIEFPLEEGARAERSPLPEEELSGVARATLEPVRDNDLRSLLERILKKDQQLKRSRSQQESEK